MKKTIHILISRIAKRVPHLSVKLEQAGLNTTPEAFVRKSLFSALSMSLMLALGVVLLLLALNLFNGFMLLIIPFVFFGLFNYFLKMPDVYIQRKTREIDSEIIFAGRFLLIELDSGVTLYDAFKNVARNYEKIGKHFTEITTNISLGTEVEKAITDAIMMTPSANFRKILWQILNAQQTGADISSSLRSVVEQITKEQMISIMEYGRKLNPLAMFYMIIAVILPSIGITMTIVLSTFLGFKLTLPFLLSFAAALGFMQYMFLALIKSSRPAVEL